MINTGDKMMKHSIKKQSKLFIIQILCILVILVAAGILAYYAIDYYRGQKTYNNIEETVTQETEDGTFTVDWQALQKLNSDIVGWIRTDNGDISYPIVQPGDNDYYLHHGVNKEELRSGAIFMDYTNTSDMTDDITYIYGHNMKDKTMFAKLNNYGDISYYKKSSGFHLYTPERVYHYQIFSSYNANVVDVEFPITFAEEEEQQTYLDEIKQKSQYDTGVDVTNGQGVVALFTCNGNDESRRVVYGVLVDSELE